MPSQVLAKFREAGTPLGADEVFAFIAGACPSKDYRGRRVLLIVPDSTRTAPIDLFFKALHEQLAQVTAALDVMVALGTHPPMTEEAICRRLGITPEQRKGRYRNVNLMNHDWQDPEALVSLGSIPSDEIADLSGGLFALDVDVRINKKLFDYDQLMILGPVFPHEVVGFSGGNKYLFPGVSGPEILNFFHWLGAVVTNPRIIGNKWTPVRKVVDRAAAMVNVAKLCFCIVVEGADLAGVFAGEPESAWSEASELSRRLHIVYKEKPFSTILSCAPRMYDDLWTGGKCMYKLEPVLADGGELIIHAPHISDVSSMHGRVIEKIGYHCRDYFLSQWDRFKNYPWGILAHSTHVRGIGTFENGVEHCRAAVTLATGIPRETCARIGLRYRDPSSIDPEDFAHREEEGVLLVRRAGEMLYQLREAAPWSR